MHVVIHTRSIAAVSPSFDRGGSIVAILAAFEHHPTNVTIHEYAAQHLALHTNKTHLGFLYPWYGGYNVDGAARTSGKMLQFNIRLSVHR